MSRVDSKKCPMTSKSLGELIGANRPFPVSVFIMFISCVIFDFLIQHTMNVDFQMDTFERTDLVEVIIIYFQVESHSFGFSLFVAKLKKQNSPFLAIFASI